MSRPVALILTAPGTNRAGELADAFDRAGADPLVLPTAAAIGDPTHLASAQLLALPGGFSHADALGAGRLWALDLRVGLTDALHAFVEAGKPVLGVCNGFQTLVRSGLLPGALGHNEHGAFVCKWVQLEARSRHCVWTAGLQEPIWCPVAHGEGRYTANEDTLRGLWHNDQVAFSYAGAPGNPNGSVDAIAGVTDATGLVLGLMPHPEDHVIDRQHPRRARGERGGLGLRLFEAGVRYLKERG